MDRGNWVDLMVAVIMLLYVWQGWQKGIFVLISEVVAWISGLLLAWWWGPIIARLLVAWFVIPRLAAEILALVVLATITTHLVYLFLSSFMLKVPKQYFPGWWQGLLAIVPSLLSGAVVVVLIMLILVRLPMLGSVRLDILDSDFYKVVVGRLEGLYRSI